jgi:hypothetical protein
VIVTKIIIIDHSTGEAGEYEFKAGPNILVSQDNSQGKSSLLKTMYYGLGLDIKKFPANWNPSKMTIKLELFNEITNQSEYVVRQNDLFYVKGVEGSISIQDYTKWLSDQLAVDLKLTNKTTKITSSITYPSPLITPFYIDQDESWSGRLFSASNAVVMYTDMPQRIFDYVLKITDDEEMSIKEKISKLNSTKSALTSKRTNINEVYIDYIDENSEEVRGEISNIFKPSETNTAEIEAFINLMDKANKKYIEQKATRIKLQRELDLHRKTAEEYKTIFKMHQHDYDEIKGICKNCKSELTEQQIQTRMEIDTNKYALSFSIAAEENEILSLEKKLSDSMKKEELYSKEYQDLSSQIEANKEVRSIAEYIEESSIKKTQEEFALVIQKLDTNIGGIEADVKELRKELNESFREVRKRVGDIQHSFSEYVNDLSRIMVGSNVSNFEFKDFRAPASSGVHVNQTYLGAYLAYMKLISKYGRYSLPYCIDSFIKNEITVNKSEGMFEATEKYLMGLNGQTIFSAVEESVVNFMKHTEKYNRVDLGERLLSSENYKSSLAHIDDIVVVK